LRVRFLDNFFPVLLLTVTITLQVPFLTAFRVVPDTRQVVREVELTVMLTVDPVTTFSPEYVATDFADSAFFIVSVGLATIFATEGGAV
jgi:hypothetical protein